MSPFTANVSFLAATTITVNLGLISALLVVASAFISSVVTVVAFTFNTNFAITSLKKDVKDLRRDTRNAIIHVEGLARSVQRYLFESTKDDPDVRTFTIRENESGHTGADFLKGE